MAGYFFDASGLVKRYVNERGTAWVNGILRPAARNALYVARVTGVEVVSAIVRRGRGGSLSAAAVGTALSQFRYEFANDFEHVAVTPRLITHAMVLAEIHALRGYDALQLASALRAHTRRLVRRSSGVILVSADAELNAAAVAEGLRVEDPNAHP
jgi:predicted nucleic acid-binding protein